MNNNIQGLIDSGNSVISLPSGEFQGPVVISKPCTVTGSCTTIWNNSGCALLINSPGVTVKDLRIEMINPGEGKFSVCTLYPVTLENVEIIGPTAGFGFEDTVPEQTRQLKIGTFRAEEQNSYFFEIYAPENAVLETDMQDIILEPSKLKQGINSVKIITGPVPSGTFIYGDILMKSVFNRRLYIQGCSSSSAEKAEDIRINSIVAPDTEELRRKADLFLGNTSQIKPRESTVTPDRTKSDEKSSRAAGYHNQEIKISSVHTLRRGERINIEAYTGKPVRVYMGQRALFNKMDIDMYAFMLDETGVTSCDDDFVFFSNKETVSGALTFMDDNSIQLDFSKVPSHIKKISFVYSIYQPGASDNFSKVMDPFVSVVQDSKEILRYTATELFAETTIIFLEIYKHSSGWKLNTIGQGYKEGLKRLCAGYGLIVS